MSEVLNVEKLFGENVFTLGKMQERLPKKAFAEVKRVMEHGGELDNATADVVAKTMKDWAVEHGATHYTHWFQPLTGITAEKHDSFVTHPDENGKMLMEFSGKELIKGEADASSFPSGGLRSTFEARGYTVWDITSPAFLKEDATGVILCIPTAFCSFTGEALDKKTPLLRSMEAISEQAMRIVRLFNKNTTATKVTPSVGAEQEYFLIDRAKYLQRKDLIFSGRTLFGAPAPKGQELEDHYFGVIRERIGAFMKDLNVELWKLGVTAKTQHNEVAPAQHELAPVYETANIAMDHNQLVMETMKKVAERHNLRCLLHEKPFAGVNGSGKHDNWSLQTDTGENLLKPGSTPSQNAQFLLFLAAFIKGVDEYQEMLRCCVSYPGNDHRLGGNEAPPAIISIFLGDELTAILDAIIQGTEYVDITKKKLTIGVDTLPEIPQDTTDRNRTSPLAFTGNKFEFRMLGSSQSIASPNVVLNTIMTEELRQFADILEKADDFQSALQKLLHDTFTAHQRIIFNGNGYDDAWVQEAKRRGLANLRDTVDCMPAYIDKKNVDLFTRHAILTETEMRARYEIHLENYCKVSAIEASTLLDMVQRHILPAASAYADRLTQTAFHKENSVPALSARMEKTLAQRVTDLGEKLFDTCEALHAALSDAPAADSGIDAARYYREQVVNRTQKAGELVSQLESLVDAKAWPYPTYADILFSV